MHQFITKYIYGVSRLITFVGFETACLLLKRRLIRRLRSRRDSSNMASLTIFPVEQGSVGSDTVLLLSEFCVLRI